MPEEQHQTYPSPSLGARLRCEECGSEAVVTKLGEAPQVSCHGRPLEVAGDPKSGNDS
jgi:hypothetical protein